jgi:hypothetical protein
MNDSKAMIDFPDTKEGHINFLMARVSARHRKMAELTTKIDDVKLALERMQTANKRDLVRVEELRILRDIRDGRLTLIDTETNREMKVAVFTN